MVQMLGLCRKMLQKDTFIIVNWQIMGLYRKIMQQDPEI